MDRLLHELVKYAAASAVALGADVGLLLAMTHAGWPYLPASAVSFLTGAAITYALSVHFVFVVHRLPNRKLEFASFVALGLAGVAVNSLVLFIAHGQMGISLLAAKGAAAGCTFATNFVMRRQLLFRAHVPRMISG